ncbi:CAP domain-containing protein [Loktanella agnita]|uniref:CAP domain-containing protein n=1 Tax=Loktanella agnita TaxID=287097 RepID=UPI00398981D1
MFSFTAVALLSACMGGGDGAPGGIGESNPGSVALVSVDPSFEAGLNGVRANVGANPVAYDVRLHRAAQLHANDMLENNYFSHTGLNGSSVSDRVRAQDYNWRALGENIAKGQQSEAAVLQAWQNSEGHRRNNENPSYEDFGLAKAGSGGNTYWVLVLAAER